MFHLKTLLVPNENVGVKGLILFPTKIFRTILGLKNPTSGIKVKFRATQLAFTYLKSTIETLEECVKSVQS